MDYHELFTRLVFLVMGIGIGRVLGLAEGLVNGTYTNKDDHV